MSAARGALAVLSGPSGVGKSTIIKRLLQEPRFALSVSATTRNPRPGEQDGVDYHFITREEFERRVAAGEFLEFAVVHGKNMYGTLKSEVERLVAAGKIVILDIDVQGARQVRGRMPALFVFVAPPNADVLIDRLSHRGTEAEDERIRRLATAGAEIACAGEYEHVIINDDLEKAVADVQRLLLRTIQDPSNSRSGADT
jgi:guanylate kinase